MHEHVFDASAAPRGQLPYVVDDGETIGDSETIIAHAIAKYRLSIDAALSPDARRTNHLVTRMLDDLYWVMSYSRWKDDRFYPAFRDAFIAQHPQLDAERTGEGEGVQFAALSFQGIGRYTPEQAYARGLADLQVLAEIVPAAGFVHGAAPTSCEAGIYGFIANIYISDPDAAEGLRRCARQSRRALRADSCGGEGVIRRVGKGAHRRAVPTMHPHLRYNGGHASRFAHPTPTSLPYRIVIASPLRSAFAIRPVW